METIHMKYLTERGKRLLELQIISAKKELERLEKQSPGTGSWQIARRYIDGLEFLLDMETT